MIEWYINVNKSFRLIRAKTLDAIVAIRKEEQISANSIKTYIKNDFEQFTLTWKSKLSEIYLNNLGRHIHFGMEGDYFDILQRDIPELEILAEKQLNDYLLENPKKGFENLLSPIILEKTYPQYINGHFRDAVLDSIIAVFDLIREKSGLESDGEALVGRVFSPSNPLLILTEMDTESGRNDQAGYLQIFQGAYKGIRNSKAHSLNHDLTDVKAAQYLVFASLLARRVEESKKV
jgi:uncharacterized protein (TIGR02391 family)